MKYVIVAKMQSYKITNLKKIILFFVLLSFDLLSKKLVFNNIDLYQFIKISSFFDITHIHNFGVSFGLFSNVISPLFLIIIAFVVVILIFYLLLNSKEILEYWGLFIIICGAIGNIIDRLINGYVIDFIYFHVTYDRLFKT